MVEKCGMLRKLRDLRDLVFDAKFDGAWVRFACYSCHLLISTELLPNILSL